jgi:tetratricopeptide (TPR) repeat protein
MGRVEKTVFISYRRTNMPWALAIYQNLTAHGYDVFFDYETIASGDFEQIILGNIRARAHFLVILTPSALERCDNPDDWLRREIETALDEKRNIVPIFLEGFDFGSPSISKYLTGKLANLKKYNGQNVPAGFFDEAMDKIRNKYLNIALDAVLHPVSTTIQRAVQKQQVAAGKAMDVKEKELTAQAWYEKGFRLNDNSDEEIHCYTEAIRLKPDYADAYCSRGVARYHKKDLDGAIKDYTEAIRLKPDHVEAYYNRGVARRNKKDLDGAIKDHTKAIRLKPDDANAYYNRALVWKQKEDYYATIADYQKYLDLGGGIRDGDQAEVEGFIRDLKKKIKNSPSN